MLNQQVEVTCRNKFLIPGRQGEATLRFTFASHRAYGMLLGALVLTVLEGAVRKWVIGSEGTLFGYIVYFSKDIVFFGILLMPQKRGVLSPPLEIFRRWLGPGTFLLTCGAILSSTKEINPIGAALTLRVLAALPVMAVSVAHKVKGVSLRLVAISMGFLTILNFVLSVIQSRLPPDHILNRYAADTTFIVAVETGVRATGTFSYISGLGLISTVGIWAGLVLLSLGENLWYRTAGWITVASGFGCGLTSVSRGPAVIGIVTLLIWMIFSGVGQLLSIRGLAAVGVVFGIAIFFGLSPVFSEYTDALIQRHEKAGDSFEDRVFGQFNELPFALNMAPFGNGLGTEQVAGNYFAQGERSFTSFETQLPRLVMETGVLGLIGFLTVSVGALLALQSAKYASTTKGEKAALLATQLLLIPMFYTNVVFNHTASAFVWMIFSAVLGATITKRPNEAH
jgi:hypothetical protein